jgi:23S rRNA G2445 N2-methylase RlmL
MEEWSEDLELEDALAVVREVRAVADQPVFAVTANYVGKRNYSSEEIKLAVARGITRAYGWHYAALDPKADLNLRVFVEHDRAYIGVRLAAEPLHRRAYKVAQVPGSLRPTVAAAMLSLGGAEPGDVVLDPACGAGTVLIEAAELGATALGGDVDMAALAAAATNISRAGAPVGLARWNARRLPLPAGAVGRVVTNLPWGRQVQVDSQLATFYREASQEIERVLAPGGRAVLLTSEPELLCLQSLALLMTVEISLHGQRPVIAIYDKL